MGMRAVVAGNFPQLAPQVPTDPWRARSALFVGQARRRPGAGPRYTAF